MSLTRKLFGPSREEIWRLLSKEVGGRYVDGGFWKGDKVLVAHGDWTVTLDTFAVSTGKTTMVFTRMRAPYVNPGGFRFTIYRRGLFSGLAERLGLQDVEVGYQQFDHDFVIKGTDESRLKQLFANPRIRELIAAQPAIHLTVKDDEGWFGPTFPDGVDELYFQTPGVIKDVERLERLYELFAETLDHLCRMGSAYQQPPGVAL
jgi:hypothetical protein